MSGIDGVEVHAPRFEHTYCSQCGADLGPGEHGVSSCCDHGNCRAVARGDKCECGRAGCVRTAGVAALQVPAEATPAMLREIALRFTFDPQQEDLALAAEAWRAALSASGVLGTFNDQPKGGS